MSMRLYEHYAVDGTLLGVSSEPPARTPRSGVVIVRTWATSDTPKTTHRGSLVVADESLFTSDEWLDGHC